MPVLLRLQAGQRVRQPIPLPQGRHTWGGHVSSLAATAVYAGKSGLPTYHSLFICNTYSGKGKGIFKILVAITNSK